MRSGQLLRFLVPAFCAAMAFLSCGGDTDEVPTCDGECQTPPAAVCEGNRSISFSILGECNNGTCVYPPIVDDCSSNGGTCEAGVCVDPIDPCDGVTCDSPPATNCEGDTLNQYVADSGECVDGGCTYEVEQTDCAARRQICEDGACVTPVNLCAGIICEEPPAAGCDGESAVAYVDVGECNPDDGECVYAEESRRDCAGEGLFCNNGRCQAENPCAGVTCNTPPDNFCNDDDDAVVYVARGTCSGGECSYLESVRDCDNELEVCEDGRCRDRLPCDGVVCNRPPAPSCRGTLLNVFEPVGACADGRCSYTLRSQECSDTDQICLDGACVDPDACFGVVCDEIPGTVCRGNTVVSYRAGVCQLPGGNCSYPEVTLDCAATGRTCVDGSCELTDPCAGVTCLTAPAPECLDGVAIEYLAPGECNPATGLCEYDPSLDDCTAVSGFTCDAGVCEFVDLCASVVCELPDFFCDGDTAVSYTDGGVCFDGECDLSASEVRENCAEAGNLCLEGECVGPGSILSEGDVVLSEVFVATAVRDPASFIEVYNQQPFEVNLSGLIVRVSIGETNWDVQLPDGSTVPAYGHFVVGNESNPADYVDTRWLSSLGLTLNSDSTVSLVAQSGTIHSVALNAESGFVTNRALSFDPGTSLVAISLPTSWCPAVREFETGRFGTPGAPNDACASRFGDSPLLITELMPSGNPLPFGDEIWFEVYNAGEQFQNLQGVRVEVGSESFLLDLPAVVDTQSYFVFARETSNLPNRQNTALPGLTLNPAGDTISLFAGETLLTSLTYDTGFPYSVGRSATVSPGLLTGDLTDPSGWCASGDAYGGITSQFGTPGTAALSCD